MNNTQETLNFNSMPLVSGIILLVFGSFLFFIALKRRNDRRKITGLTNLTTPDRMIDTKGTEKVLRLIAIMLFLSGFIIITTQALKNERISEDSALKPHGLSTQNNLG